MYPADQGLSPPPGSPAYLPALFTRIRAAHPVLPVDPVVLQSVLLCLIARTPGPASASVCTDGQDASDERINSAGLSMNLVLRTKEEDIRLLSHIVTLILTTVFGFSAHRHKVGHTQQGHVCSAQSVGANPMLHPDSFLRGLFFRPPRKRPRRVRQNADPTLLGTTGSHLSRAYAPQRSSTYPIPPSSPYVTATSELDQADQQITSAGHEQHEQLLDTNSLASSRRPFQSSVTPASTLRMQRPPADRTRIDPPPLLSVFVPPEGDDLSPCPSFPQAVVVSGLEQAGAPAQRALTHVLSEGKLVLQENDEEEGAIKDFNGTWNLPNDFLMVYVCRWDPHERPAVLRGLLDKFAMSVDVVIEPSTRQAFTTYRSTLVTTPHTSPFPSPRALPSELFPTSTGTPTNSPIRSAPSRISTPVIPPVIPPSEVAHLRSLACASPDAQAHAYTSIHPSLRAYLCDLFSATRHHPALDGTLLTRRAHKDAEALVRAYRVLVGDSIGAELVRVAGSNCAISEDGDEFSADSGEGTLEWDKPGMDLDWMVGGGSDTGKGRISNDTDTSGSMEHVVRLNLEEDIRKGRQSTEQDLPQPPDFREQVDDHLRKSTHLRSDAEVWDISEVDVARVFPRVVSHRLRVREGPDHEILGSVMWPAAGIAPAGVRGASASAGSSLHPENEDVRWERKTVKEILVGILAEV
ncbi:predicted protein [Sparassis crispa]|uniref:Uncharacterized protein n=1 Tax=Sparassis crispa TaxID=139825 RepID=A0A401GES4_9APHY|nr:predicted protein [Sparassis crispa]GBE80603.1 predicted protein [Sparassis crispa]